MNSLSRLDSDVFEEPWLSDDSDQYHHTDQRAYCVEINVYDNAFDRHNSGQISTTAPASAAAALWTFLTDYQSDNKYKDKNRNNLSLLIPSSYLIWINRWDIKSNLHLIFRCFSAIFFNIWSRTAHLSEP